MVTVSQVQKMSAEQLFALTEEEVNFLIPEKHMYNSSHPLYIVCLTCSVEMGIPLDEAIVVAIQESPEQSAYFIRAYQELKKQESTVKKEVTKEQ